MYLGEKCHFCSIRNDWFIHVMCRYSFHLFSEVFSGSLRTSAHFPVKEYYTLLPIEGYFNVSHIDDFFVLVHTGLPTS